MQNTHGHCIHLMSFQVTNLPTVPFPAHGGKHDVTVHVNGKHHKEAASATSSSRSVTSFYKPWLWQSVTEAGLCTLSSITSLFCQVTMRANY